jgi:hypothetical protein
MILKEVKGENGEREFLDFPKALYERDPNWVAPLDDEIISVFDPASNELLDRGGEAIRWLVRDETGEPLGRIAAFHDGTKGKGDKFAVGGIGFFECINDQSAANTLFNAAMQWLKDRGIKAADGPINFGENNSYWGLLVEGFTLPAYGMNYHMPYYRKLFEDFGFNLYYKQFSYRLDMQKKFPERFWKIAEWVCSKPDYSFRHFKWSESDKYISDLISVYNQAWSDFKDDFSPLSPEEVRNNMEKARPIIDEEMVWFAYFKNEPIAFYIMFPDANQILRHLDGRMNWWNKLKFLYYKKTGAITRARAQAAGVVPRFQNSGVESGIFWQLKHVMDRKPQFKEVELSWVGDFNPRMLSIYKAVGADHYKTHHTYRYMIDKSIPFQRFMPEKLEEPVAKKVGK